MRERHPSSATALAAGLGLVLLVLGLLSLRLGASGLDDLASIARGVGGALGVAQPLAERSLQGIVELRLWRVLTAIGVGATLALSGGLLQGVFRNGLASPSVLGITSGASLGASIAILVVGGYGPAAAVFETGPRLAPLFVTMLSFVGAIGTAFLVTLLATSQGRISVPTLLLVGIAINSLAAGLIAAIQSLALADYDVARAIFAWTFGNLDDRAPRDVVTVWVGLAMAASVIPFVALELDLFAGGEDDARSLGVDTQRVKLLALVAAALAAAVAVSVAGAISFVGLVVPHLLRLVSGSSHRSLLPLCLLGGPVFLLGTDVLQRWILGASALQPGVVMSLVGGPFFLVLLVLHRKRLQAW